MKTVCGKCKIKEDCKKGYHYLGCPCCSNMVKYSCSELNHYGQFVYPIGLGYKVCRNHKPYEPKKETCCKCGESTKDILRRRID